MSSPIQIPGWSKFQRYKRKRPPWIRLYRDLLDKPEWGQLSGDAAKLLVELWLKASDQDHELDGLITTPTKDLAWQLRRPYELLVSALLELERQGFIIMLVDDVSTMCALREQNVSPETETEAETETETEREGRASAPSQVVEIKPKAKRARPLPDDWKPNAEHAGIAADRSLNVLEEALKMRDWALGKGAVKKDWDATFRNWLRNARPAAPITGKPAWQAAKETAEQEAAVAVGRRFQGFKPVITERPTPPATPTDSGSKPKGNLEIRLPGSIKLDGGPNGPGAAA